MDVWSFLVGASDDRARAELAKARDAKKAEHDAAWLEYERLGDEIDALIERQKAVHARVLALRDELRQADLAVLAGPPRPERH